MKRDLHLDALDEVLCEWYRWAKSASILPAGGACAMFRNAKSSRGYDSVHDIVDGELEHDRLKTVDFHVSELPPDQRTAIGLHARNLVTGNSVWSSARLPSDPFERTVILTTGKQTLTRRLKAAGIL